MCWRRPLQTCHVFSEAECARRRCGKEGRLEHGKTLLFGVPSSNSNGDSHYRRDTVSICCAVETPQSSPEESEIADIWPFE